jgi:Tol biopolymer transport system component
VPTTAATRPLRWLTLAFALATGACYDTSSVPTQQDAGAWVPPPVTPVVPRVDEPFAPTVGLAFVVDTGAIPGGRLLFPLGDDPFMGIYRIYSMRPDGTGLTPVTPKDEYAWAPAWSPGDSLIAYELSTYWSEVIEVVRPDGTGRRRVTNDGTYPFWLADGRIGFSCLEGICTVDASGANRTVLLAHGDDRAYGYTYSPDGSMIAFVRLIENESHVYVTAQPSNIFVMRRDGTDLHRITTTDSASTYEFSPSWSRDGRQIAFLSWSYGVAVADADGGRLHGISHSPPSKGLGLSGPAWSPDGTKVLFSDEAGKVYIANADGSGLIRRVSPALPAGYAPWGSVSWSSR